jgi:hypothetical protein
MRLSQGQLKTLAECPRKYQHTFLDALTVPPAPEQLAAQQWGDRFHLLMQQRELGLPIDPLLTQDADLQACLDTLQHMAPDLFDLTGEIFRQSEHGCSWIAHGYWFTVVYDLLRMWRDRAEIVDWKTYLQPRSPGFLQADWQTRLYLYGLVETSHYAPHQVSMTYWFVRIRHPETREFVPQFVRLSYSAEQHQQTERDLADLCDRLTQFLASGDPLPQVPIDNPACDRCAFALRCQRGSYTPLSQQTIPTLADIPEIAL